jgi:serine/threonine-protein kinase
MSLQPGTRFGSYEVSAAIGSGGMGEVWRATDTTLGREVALKVLPADFADDEDRHARFEREAKVLASLNHPNIATLYGLEHVEQSGTGSGSGTGASPQAPKPSGPHTIHCLVMELVEGEGLDERITRGPIAIDEAIPTALQIAEALEAAHEQGIVHRDLKPANIKITSDGTVKVLDFGLAKTWAADDDSSVSMSPTMTKHATEAGVILGTAAYMSPEQARGQAVDRRADIWAFGVVLWEMITGKKLFAGETVSDVLASVLKEAPDLEALPSETPHWLRRLITRCLQRDPHDRLQWIGDARVELEADQEPRADTPVELRPGRSAAAMVIGVVGLAAAAITWASLRPAPEPIGPLHVDLSEAAFKQFTNSAISPDGRWVAYALGEDSTTLQLRSVDGFDVRAVPGTIDAENPFFSPDGKWVAFFLPVSDGIGKVSLTGGTAIRIPGVTVTGSFNTGTWHPDGLLIFSNAVIDGRAWNGLATVPVSGGDPEILSTPEPDDIIHHEPTIVPGTDWVLFTIENPEDWAIGAVSLATGESKIVVNNASTPIVLDSGHLLVFRYEQSNVLMYRFDSDRAAVEGEPTVVLQEVGNGARYGGRYAVSHSGTLIYTPLDDSSLLVGGRTVVWVDRNGTVQQIIGEKSSWAQPRISPDGQQLLVRRVLTPDCDLWTYDLDRGALTRITFEDDAHDPLWHPTGDSVLYAGDIEPTRVLFQVLADGTGTPTPLAEAAISLRAASWSGDGRLLALGARGPTLNDDIWVLDPDVDPEPRPFLDSRFGERFPAFSPDGRWFAYTSDQSGRWEVYVRPYPGPGGRIQVSIEGGSEPLWSGDGRELFYRTSDQMMVVSVDDTDGLDFSRPRMVFTDPYLRPSQISADVHSYDVSPDGSRFLMIQRDSEGLLDADLHVVIGWLDTLDEN